VAIVLKRVAARRGTGQGRDDWCNLRATTLKAQATAKRAKDKTTMGNSMRRGLPQLIVVAAVGLAFGMVYRYFLDEPSEASVANYLRSGGHGISVALVAWGANRYFNLRASTWLRTWPAPRRNRFAGLRIGDRDRRGHRGLASADLRSIADDHMAVGRFPENSRDVFRLGGCWQRDL
jgi:hypothetical protein